MLREEVVKEWRSCQEKITKLSKDIELLDEHIFESALPSFPTGLDTIRRNLDFWTSSDFRTKIYETKEKVLEIKNEKLLCWVSSYLNTISMFEELTKGWKQERDNSSGPTIEEVD